MFDPNVSVSFKQKKVYPFTSCQRLFKAKYIVIKCKYEQNIIKS